MQSELTMLECAFLCLFSFRPSFHFPFEQLSNNELRMSTQGVVSLNRWTCPTCPFATNNPGSRATHKRACERKKRKRDDYAEDLARKEAAVRSETHDDAGRKLWRTAHNDLCEVCGKD